MLHTALRFIVRTWYRLFPLEMVQWWMRTGAVQARLTTHPDGYFYMEMRGEKYPMDGYPRGHLLFGSLSPLKHQIKNKIFNDAWKRIADGEDRGTVVADIKEDILDFICDLGTQAKYDMLPPHRFVPPVREVHRAWTAVEHLHPSPKMTMVKDILCFVLQEDDGYRYRVQWLAKWLPKKHPVEALKWGLELMYHAEVVDDMKERINLLKTILLLVLEDAEIRRLFEAFVKECDWNKVKLTKKDLYYARAKYFRPDYSDPDTLIGRIKNEILY